MALFVLGAGATRGCSFVNPKNHVCLPPLDGDFFTQIQRINNKKHFKLIEQVLEDTVELFGNNFQISMETVFTTVEHTISMLNATGDTRDFKKSELQAKRDRLVQAIHAVLEDSLTEFTGKGKRSSLTPKQCEFHKTLVKDILRKRDDIISFNYDCVIDYSLKKYGDGLWNPRYGYAFPLGAKGSNLNGDKEWQPASPSLKDETIRLYKLHGSLHFRANRNKINLKERPYTKQRGNTRFDIIPPEWNKAFDKGIFRPLWNSAAKAINRAESLIVVGYSLPLTDSHAIALFTTAIKKKSLKSLIIVNPDKAVRLRIRSLLHRGINPKTKVISFNYFEEFVACPREIWD